MVRIGSILDLDMYKLTQHQAIFHQCPGNMVTYEFRCRSDWADFTAAYAEIEEAIMLLEQLKCNHGDAEYLRCLELFHEDYLSYLLRFRFDPRTQVKMALLDGELQILVEGLWEDVMLYETFILSIVEEAYCNTEYGDVDLVAGQHLLAEKIQKIKNHRISSRLPFHLVDFGTRRRFSMDWQSYVIEKLVEHAVISGTSNLYFARKFGIDPVGTMAHEWLQGWQALAPLPSFQKAALHAWAEEYRGKLGIALSDIVGMDAFLRDFDPYLAKLYDGCRHDSGDPFDWGLKLMRHYDKLGIDAGGKTVVFSDGLDVELAFELNKALAPHFGKVVFGIGTNLTNDIPGVTPASIVMKMTECNGMPTAKVSDSPGKSMCPDPEFENVLRRLYRMEV